MKFKTLYFLLIVVFLNNINAQNKSKKEKIGSVGGYEMGYIDCIKKGNSYTISYENQNEVQVNGYSDFSIKLEEFENVYNTIITGFEKKQKSEISIPTVLNYVELDYTKFLGKMRVRFVQSKKKGALGVSFSAWYSLKQIKKLFGKL
ncbi:hypothetical protein ACFQ5N_14105 [Lutibacter holmesii]|uniref:Uncharacterized protein n=1 Tax=Lutibacter holmesii TaxID=1137985 RepID=A0ABW3WTQ1_9FLAO